MVKRHELILTLSHFFLILLYETIVQMRDYMEESFSLYCDESCHLEHDQNKNMLLGSIWCPTRLVQGINNNIKLLKRKHNANGELKWTKVSPSKINFYIELVDLFFNTKELNFRCVIVQDKSKLNHSYFNHGSHDSFYYKMYYYLIRNIVSDKNKYRIYLDIKDTRSQLKIEKLHNILCNSLSDFDHSLIERLQHIRSYESNLLQLCDFLLGAVSYKSHCHNDSEAKLKVIRKIEGFFGPISDVSSPPWEEKYNLFFFTPRVTIE